MDLSNLKMTLKAYQKISKSVLSQFVTRPELDDAINNTKVEFDAKLEGYVEEIPVEFKDNGKTYGRQYKKWVEIDVTYKKPEILLFELVGIESSYEKDTSVKLTAVRHQESNIKHINGKLKLYRDNVLIATIDPSEEIVESPISNEFVIESDTVFRFEMESDIGNIYDKSITISCVVTSYMYSGYSKLDVMTPESMQTLNRTSIEYGKKIKYNLPDVGYIWWCTSEEIEDIRQDGLYPIDKVESRVSLDGIDFYCYRTTEELVADVWRFVIVKKEPEPPVKVGDLRLGGAITENMTSEGLADLTKKDFMENYIYTVNLAANAFVWICCPYEIDIMDDSGAYPDFTLVDQGINLDGFSFYCYRSNEPLVANKWKFKFEKQ